MGIKQKIECLMIGIVGGATTLPLSTVVQLWLAVGIDKASFREIIEFLNKTDVILIFTVLGAVYGLLGSLIIIFFDNLYLPSQPKKYFYSTSLLGLEIGLVLGLWAFFTFGLHLYLDIHLGYMAGLIQFLLFAFVGVFVGFIIGLVRYLFYLLYIQ